MASWFPFFKKSTTVSVSDDPVVDPVADHVAQHVADPVADHVAQHVADPVADPVAQPVADPVAQPVAQPIAWPNKTKNRQIHWMVTDCTHYRNAEINVRCTFFSNLRAASYAFKNTVDNAIDRYEDDFYKVDHSDVKKENEEFFTLKKFDGDNRGHYYHRSREFECGGVRVYLSEVHLGRDCCVELGGPSSW